MTSQETISGDTFEQTLAERFGKTFSEPEFVEMLSRRVGALGFHADNTITAIGCCRDELCRSLMNSVRGHWGNPFKLTSLAGLIFAGKTGFGAAQAHSPLGADGKPRYLFIAMTHIGIGADGTIGSCRRPGIEQDSNACGALVSFHGELPWTKGEPELIEDDLEQSLLRRRLLRQLEEGADPDLVELTKAAHDAIAADLTDIMQKTAAADSDYIVASGIQVHDPRPWHPNRVFVGPIHGRVGGAIQNITL